MHPTKFIPIYFFQALSGLLSVIFTAVGSGVYSLSKYLGLLTHVNFSDFYSNSLSYKWHPPADFSCHFPDTTTVFESSSFCTSIDYELNTIKLFIKKSTGKCEFRIHFFFGHAWNNDKWSLCGLVESIECCYFITLVHTFFVPFPRQ